MATSKDVIFSQTLFLLERRFRGILVCWRDDKNATKCNSSTSRPYTNLQCYHICLESQGQPFINGWPSIGWWTQSLHRKWLEITKHPFLDGCLGFQVVVFHQIIEVFILQHFQAGFARCYNYQSNPKSARVDQLLVLGMGKIPPLIGNPYNGAL